MHSKEFIKKQVKSFTSSITSEQFMELNENESSLIILDVALKDYTLTEIAKLVEDNNARITRLEVIPNNDGLSLLVSLKVDVTDLSPILRSFERFNYNVVYHYMKEGKINDTHDDRLKELLHYLDM